MIPRNHLSRRRALGSVATAALVALAACSQDTAGPEAPLLEAAADHVTPTEYGHLTVCKAGVGSGSFSVQGMGQISSTTAENIDEVFPLAAGQCHTVFAVFIEPGVGTSATVTVTETPDPGFTVMGASKQFFDVPNPPPAGVVSGFMNGDPVTVGDDSGAVITFTNAALGNEGCTPGYYKNLKKHRFAWDAAGLSPDQPVSSVFSEAANAPYAALGGATLHEGLSFKGGKTVADKAETLLRAAIAAILNANNSVDYSISAAQVIADTNAALASQDAGAIIALAGTLDAANNGPGGCPLGNRP